jgi:hypothetical protein
VTVGKFKLVVDMAEAISGLTDAAGREWAGRPGAALLWLHYSLGTNAQMAAYRDTYCAGNIRSGDVHCDEDTYGKPGLPRNQSVLANATMRSIWGGAGQLARRAAYRRRRAQDDVAESERRLHNASTVTRWPPLVPTG